jgi:hypothetical protein
MDGIDNGFILFKDFRIPYVNLLDKFSQIENNKFVSKIDNDEQRFALQLGSLSGGRLSIC